MGGVKKRRRIGRLRKQARGEGVNECLPILRVRVRMGGAGGDSLMINVSVEQLRTCSEQTNSSI